ncbi:MAG: GIY-YIG nuclease family protein, partial [Flavobacteriales bacterium]
MKSKPCRRSQNARSSALNWAYVDFYYADIHLPECSGIYAVFAARAGRDVCVYVGQSKDLKNRWKAHNRTLACLREGA